MKGTYEKPKGTILVSNPGKQYVHQLLRGLEKNGFVPHFFTSFWYKPGIFPFNFISFLPGKLGRKLEKEFKKRYDENLEGKFIFQFPVFELIREFSDRIFGQRFSEKMQFYRDRLHDKWVASKLDDRYSMMIGYEESCLHSFKKAKRLGIVTVLDLSQVHYKEIDSIGRKFPVFNHLYKNKKLRQRINCIKEAELSMADYVLCLSAFAKESLVKHGIQPEKIAVVHLGFDPDKFFPKQTYSSLGKLKVVFVGTLTRRKGIDLILKVQEQLSDRMDLTLVGPMADAKDLLDSYKGKYTWYPYKEHGDLNVLLNQSDLFVFPSYLDSWAMVVIEAMACGLPVIVSENTGAGEAVINNSGFVIPAGEADLLKEKISYFYKHKEALQIMGKSARKESLNFTWEVYHEKVSSMILKIQNLNERR